MWRAFHPCAKANWWSCSVCPPCSQAPIASPPQMVAITSWGARHRRHSLPLSPCVTDSSKINSVPACFPVCYLFFYFIYSLFAEISLLFFSRWILCVLVTVCLLLLCCCRPLCSFAWENMCFLAASRCCWWQQDSEAVKRKYMSVF